MSCDGRAVALRRGRRRQRRRILRRVDGLLRLSLSLLSLLCWLAADGAIVAARVLIVGAGAGDGDGDAVPHGGERGDTRGDAGGVGALGVAGVRGQVGGVRLVVGGVVGGGAGLVDVGAVGSDAVAVGLEHAAADLEEASLGVRLVLHDGRDVAVLGGVGARIGVRAAGEVIALVADDAGASGGGGVHVWINVDAIARLIVADAVVHRDGAAAVGDVMEDVAAGGGGAEAAEHAEVGAEFGEAHPAGG